MRFPIGCRHVLEHATGLLAHHPAATPLSLLSHFFTHKHDLMGLEVTSHFGTPTLPARGCIEPLIQGGTLHSCQAVCAHTPSRHQRGDRPALCTGQTGCYTASLDFSLSDSMFISSSHARLHPPLPATLQRVRGCPRLPSLFLETVWVFTVPVRYNSLHNA